jgi:hypothetical protein
MRGFEPQMDTDGHGWDLQGRGHPAFQKCGEMYQVIVEGNDMGTERRKKKDHVKVFSGVNQWESRFNDLRKKLGAKAKKLGLVTYEDVFKAVS